jgi:iron(III) transport system permease protein
MLKESVTADGGFSLDGYRALLRSEGQLARLMAHSLSLSLLTESVSTLVGVPLGVLLGKTDLPLRGSLTLLFAVPLLFPPYVLAVAWFSILGRTGLLGAVLAVYYDNKGYNQKSADCWVTLGVSVAFHLLAGVFLYATR